MGRGKLVKVGRYLVGGALLAALIVFTGCSRGFYRRQADREVQEILDEKDRFPQWKIENYHVYPDPRARFADPFNPDREPMPPDDPAVRLLSPNPQRPGKAGIARVEGSGYLNLLAHWDTQNRSLRALEGVAPAPTASKSLSVWPEGLHPVAHLIEEPKKEATELGPPPAALQAFPCLGLGMTQPYLIRLDQAVELGLITSREYQTRRENLYLSALPVSVERFAFTTQFFALEEAVRQRSGTESLSGYGNFWRFNSTLGFTKLFSTGGLLLAAFANQTIINLTGTDRHTISTSRADLDLIQPLLRGGGRAVTLEGLTQAERDLLYEIRSYARFRKEYFQYITGGGEFLTLGEGGSIRGAGITPGALSLATGNPAVAQIRANVAGRIDLAVGTIAGSEGYLPTLLRAAVLRDEEKNVEYLQTVILPYFVALEEIGDVSNLQVDQVRLDILNGESRVLQRRQELNDALDRFNLQLGIPIPIPLMLDDLATRPITRQLDKLDDTVKQVEGLIKKIEREWSEPDDAPKLRDRLRNLLLNDAYTKEAPKFRKKLDATWADLMKLGLDALNKRREAIRTERRGLLDLKLKLEQVLKMSETEATEYKNVMRRLDDLDWESDLGSLEINLRRYEAEPWKAKAKAGDRATAHNQAFRDVLNSFKDVLAEATNERLERVATTWDPLPPLLVEGVNLLEADEQQCFDVVARTALANRLDLMNARARLVDSWRQLAIFANSLLGTFTVGYHVDSITPPGEAKPLAFSGRRTRQQLFFVGELPLVRITERNAYRASLIAYQRARRELMAFEDSIVAAVRQEVRQLRVLAETFKIQQRAILLAYTQVESSLEEFRAPQPPATGAPGTGVQRGSVAALTQQLLNAQRSLPQTQNLLYTTWTNYQIVRQQLFLDIEMMPLDYRGVWIDEYSYRQPEHCLDQPEWKLGDGPGPERFPEPERLRARLLPPS